LATLAEGRKAVACSRPLDPKSTQMRAQHGQASSRVNLVHVLFFYALDSAGKSGAREPVLGAELFMSLTTLECVNHALIVLQICVLTDASAASAKVRWEEHLRPLILFCDFNPHIS
jgi:hypothetical protein